MLEQYILEKRKEKDILLMTHIVLGYPSVAASLELVETMVTAGVDLIELQIPFSEPQADGPRIVAANQHALDSGITVAQCMDCARELTQRFSIPFLFMGYYNILHACGVETFARKAAQAGIRGTIIADMPLEESQEYRAALKKADLCPVFIFAPNSSADRMQTIADHTAGFVYCVARKGVTGEKTAFSPELEDYIARCRQATTLPLALGFGVSSKEDVSYLTGKVDIAVIGSQVLRILDEQGLAAVGEFLHTIRE